MSIFTQFHLKFHHKFLFVFLHWYSSHSLDFTSVYDFSFATASVFEHLRKHNWYVNFDSFILTFMITFCLCFCIDAADTQSRFYICFCILFHLCNSLRFWTFTKTPLVCQFWQEFHLNFQYKFILVFMHWCSWHSLLSTCVYDFTLAKASVLNVYEKSSGMSILTNFHHDFHKNIIFLIRDIK
jgi:hypothetical protein